MDANERIYYSREAEQRAVQEMTKLVLLTLILGLGVGATLALLFAPMSGKKFQDELAQSIEERVHDGQSSVMPMIKRLEKDFVDLRKQVEERVPHRR